MEGLDPPDSSHDNEIDSGIPKKRVPKKQRRSGANRRSRVHATSGTAVLNTWWSIASLALCMGIGTPLHAQANPPLDDHEAGGAIDPERA